MIENLIYKLKNLQQSKNFSWASAHDRIIIIALTLISALIWYLCEPIVFTYDSYAYLDAAKAIAGIKGSSLVYFRAPFLPLLLAATSVTHSQTFSWFILMQFILGISCSILVYSSLRRISRPIGFLASLLFISTFVSFVYSKSIMTEEIYLFGWCLCIDGVLAYLKKPTRFRLSQITLALLILAMTRAQGSFVAFVVLPFIFFCLPKRMLELIVAAFFLCLAIFSYSHFYAQKTNLIGEQKINSAVSSFGITNTTGKMLFVIVYWDPFRRMNWSLVHPENGPATTHLFSELRQYYSVPKNLPANPSDLLFGQFSGNSEGLIQAMENRPDGQYWWAIWTAMDYSLGAGAADKLLMDATFETILAHPSKVAYIYLRNLLMAILTTESSYVWLHPRIVPESVGTAFAKELSKSGDTSKCTHLAKFLNIYFPTIKISLFILAIGLSKKLWCSRFRKPAIFCALLFFYNHLTVAMAAAPESRYTFYGFPLLLIFVTLGLKLILGKEKP